MDTSAHTQDILDMISNLPAAPETQGQPIAGVARVAVPLRADEERALRQHLERYWGRPVELQIEIAPSILGGVWVRVGDTVIDGSVQGRLETLRQHLRTQARIMIASAPLATGGDAP